MFEDEGCWWGAIVCEFAIILVSSVGLIVRNNNHHVVSILNVIIPISLLVFLLEVFILHSPIYEA